MNKQPMYMWQCVVCSEYMYSEDITLKHCRRLVQWIKGIEGIGIDMNSPMMKIHVTGYIEISQENLDEHGRVGVEMYTEVKSVCMFV